MSIAPMMLIEHVRSLLDPTLFLDHVQAIGEPTVLVDYAGRSAILMIVALAVALCVRGRSAALRHAILFGSALSILVLPLIEGVRIELPERFQHTITVAPVESSRPAEIPSPVRARSTSPLSSAAPATGDGVVTADSPISFTRIMIAVWLMGVILNLARLVAALAAVKRAIRASIDAVLPDGGSHKVPMRVSNAVTYPAVAGLLSPVILLPEKSRHWSQVTRQCVVAHENAHAARRDHLTQLLTHLMCAIHWFNPLAWLLLRRQKFEAERASDEAVLLGGISGVAYSEALLAVARQPRISGHSPLLVLMAAQPSELTHRVHSALAWTSTAGNRFVGRRSGAGFLSAVAWAFAALLFGTARVEAASTRSDGTPADRAAGSVRNAGHEVQGMSTAGYFQSRGTASTGAGSVESNSARDISAFVAGLFEDANANSIPVGATALEVEQKQPGARLEPDQRNDSVADPSSERMPAPAGQLAHARVAARMLASGPDSMMASRLETVLSHAPAFAGDLVAERAAWALTQSSGTSLVVPLIARLGSGNWRERAYAAWALGASDNPIVVDALVHLLEDDVWRVRANAAAALNALGDVRARTPMLSAVVDEAWQVRSEAVEFLRKINDPRDRDIIARARADSHIAVRMAAGE